MAADGGWGWMVVVGCFMCNFVLFGMNRSMGIIYVLLQERFEASATDTALAASIFLCVRCFGGKVIRPENGSPSATNVVLAIVILGVYVGVIRFAIC